MLVALTRAGCDVWQLECQASTASVQSDHLLHRYMLPLFIATDQLHRPSRCCWNSAHVATRRYLARLCHGHNVLVHCLAERETCLQQCCGLLVAVSTSATRLGNTVRWFLLHAQRKWGLDTAGAHVSRTNPRYGRVVETTVVTWAEFQQSVVERNITSSQMERFCILQGSVVTFFRCGR